MSTSLPTLMGFGVLALQVFLIRWFLHHLGVLGSDDSLWLWLIGYVILSLLAAYVWFSDEAPKDPSGWGILIGVSLVFGGVFYAIDVMARKSNTPDLWTLAACPGLTTVAGAGFVRALLLPDSESSD
jgi:hypothetical protein